MMNHHSARVSERLEPMIAQRPQPRPAVREITNHAKDWWKSSSTGGSVSRLAGPVVTRTS